MPFHRRTRLVLGVAIAWASVMPAAFAQVTWTGTAANGNWGTANAWSGAGLANNFNSALVFQGTNLLSNTNTLTGGTATSLTFNAGSGPFLISGNAFTLTGNIANSSSNLQSIANNIALVGNSTVSGTSVTLSGTLTNSGTNSTLTNSVASGALVTLGSIALSNDNTGRTFTLAGTGNTTITGSIGNGGTGAGVLTVTNSGTTTVTGAGNWTGNTTVGSTALANATLVFGGAAGANSGASTYVLQGGRLILDNTGAGNNIANRIADTSAIQLGTGAFIYNGSDQASTNSSETVGAITYAPSNGVGGAVTVTYGGSNLATLTAASLSYTAGYGSLLVNGRNLGKNSTDTGSVGKLILTTAPTLVGTTNAQTSGINSSAQNTKIVAYLVGESGTASGGLGTATGTANTFLTYDAGAGLRPLNPTEEFTNNAISSGNNTYLTQSTTAGSTASINSLVLNGGNLSIADGATLTNTSGAILFASSNAIVPQGTTGALTFGSGQEAVITINPGVTGTIATRITPTGANNVTYSGAGTLALSGSNNYTGTTYVNSGVTLVLGNRNVFGSGTVTLNQNNTSGTTTLQASTDLTGANAIPNYVNFNTGNTSGNIVRVAFAGTNSIQFSGTANQGSGANFNVLNNLASNATLTFDKTILIASSRNVNVFGTGNTAFSGGFQTNAGVNLNSTGTTTLTGSNSGGNMNLNGSNAVYVIGNANAFGNGTGTLTISQNSTIQLLSPLSLPGSVLLNAGPTFTGSNSITWTGTTTQGGGNRTITNDISSGSVTLSAVNLTVNATPRNLTLAGSGNTTLSGTIADGPAVGSLTITNTGTTTLSNANTYSGVTTLSGTGTVILGNNFAFGGSGTTSGLVTISSAATLQASTPLSAVANNILVTGTGATFSGANGITLTGTLTQQGGSRTLTNNLASDQTLTLGAVALSGTDTSARILTLAGTGNTTFAGIIANGTGASGSGLTVANAGTTTLSAANTYTGTTNVNAGVVALSGVGTLGATTNALALGGGSLDLGGLSGIVGNVSVTTAASGNTIQNGTLTGTAFSISNASGTATVTAALAGTANLTKTGAGTLVLGSANTYTGTTSVNAGVVALSGVGTLGATTNSLVLGGGSLDLGGLGATAGNVSVTTAASGNTIQNGTLTGTAFSISNASGTATVTAILAGSGAGLTKNGAGTLVLAGDNTFTGQMNVLGTGTVSVSKIGNAGVAGNLGAAVNSSGTSPIIFSPTGGNIPSILYTGAGETSNRNITLDYQLGQGAAIIANGAGGLTLSGSVNMPNKNSTNGATAFVLTGTNTNANAVTGAMTEGGGNKISISKRNTGTWVLSGNRNYSAVTDVQNGLLQFDSIANTGSASALGTGNSPYAVLPAWGSTTMSSIGTTRIPYQIALGGTATSGTLEYIGVGSGSSNRSFGFNNNGTLSAASGAGSLSLSGTFAPVVSANVAFTLAAGNSGTNTISGVISDLAAAATTANATASGVNQISVASSAGFSIGQTLTGAGIAANSIITGISTGTLFLSKNTTGSISAGTSLSAAGGTMSLAKTGLGTWALSGANTYTGPTTVSSGRLLVSAGNINASSDITVDGAGAEFRYNSATALTAPLTLTQGTLSGTGSINTPVSIGTNVTLSPGNSPGVQTYQSGTFAGGGTYAWEINNWVSGTAGVNYDRAVFTNGLAITSSSASPFTIDLVSLQANNTAGAVPGFNSGLKGLSFAIATGSMTGYDPADFTLDTSGFLAANTVSGSANGGFWLSTNSGSTQLILNYAPSAVYALTASPTAANIRVGGSTVITGSIANSTADRTGADAIAFSNLSVGTGSLSTTTGTVASGAGASGTLNYSGTSAGQFTFTPSASVTNVNLGTAALAGAVTSGTLTVWNPAVATTSGSVNLGTVIVGATTAWSQSLSITNSAPNDGFSEKLNAAFGTLSGVTTNSGSFNLLAAGSTNNAALTVSLATNAVGAQSGSAEILFATDGQGTSGLGTAALSPQTVNVYGTVLDHALPGFVGAGIADPYAQTTLSLDFGSVDEAAGVQTRTYSLTNLASLLYGSGLTAGLDLTGFTANGDGFTSGLSAFNDLVAGGTSSLFTASFTPSGQGTFSKAFTLSFSDNRNISGAASVRHLTISAQVVVVPEPGAIVLAGMGVAAAAWGLARRRR